MDKNEELFKEMNYLNIKEYQGFCDKHKIPYHIHILVDGRLKKTSEKDRKTIVLARMRKFVASGKIEGPTVFAENVVSFIKLTNIAPTTKLHFAKSDKNNRLQAQHCTANQSQGSSSEFQSIRTYGTGKCLANRPAAADERREYQDNVRVTRRSQLSGDR